MFLFLVDPNGYVLLLLESPPLDIVVDISAYAPYGLFPETSWMLVELTAENRFLASVIDVYIIPLLLLAVIELDF